MLLVATFSSSRVRLIRGAVEEMSLVEIKATSSPPEAYSMLKAPGVELPLRRSLRGVPRRFDQADIIHLVLPGFPPGVPRPFD